ncbi:MAG: DUF1906 domain-containing protein [Firmicutes bacterium]|nr:DUF1906 domain-containing protein [Bacillota bacterium]
MTLEEARAITAAGLKIVSVWETDPTRPDYFSFARGRQDGLLALAAARRAGQPAGSAICFAVDYEPRPADLDRIAAYFRGVRAAGGPYRVGAYGSHAVIARVHAEGLAEFLWQTAAWSGARVHEAAHLFQYRNGVNWCGFTNDADHALREPGWWSAAAASMPSGTGARARAGRRGA